MSFEGNPTYPAPGPRPSRPIGPGPGPGPSRPGPGPGPGPTGYPSSQRPNQIFPSQKPSTAGQQYAPDGGYKY